MIKLDYMSKIGYILVEQARACLLDFFFLIYNKHNFFVFLSFNNLFLHHPKMPISHDLTNINFTQSHHLYYFFMLQPQYVSLTFMKIFISLTYCYNLRFKTVLKARNAIKPLNHQPL